MNRPRPPEVDPETDPDRFFARVRSEDPYWFPAVMRLVQRFIGEALAAGVHSRQVLILQEDYNDAVKSLQVLQRFSRRDALFRATARFPTRGVVLDFGSPGSGPSRIVPLKNAHDRGRFVTVLLDAYVRMLGPDHADAVIVARLAISMRRILSDPADSDQLTKTLAK